MQKLILASHNQGKLDELRRLLARFNLDIQSAGDYDLTEPDETETSFEGNARIKAHFVSRETGHMALADDSGLAVDAIDGTPGVYTADWTETPSGRDPMVGMMRIERELDEGGATAPFTASFHSVLCVAWPDGREALFSGRVDGALTFPPRGLDGFGYDPIFIANGQSRTFGEMDRQTKAQFSHRTRAFDALLANPPFDIA